jgi:anaerobic selenocysteine-containing dehydrogenase
VPHGWAPFAQGGFPTPSGRCEFSSERAARAGFDPLPDYIPPRESAESDPSLAQRYPLAFLSPPARNFLNSTFGNLPVAREPDAEPRVEIHPDDAGPRGIADGEWVRLHNDRGSLRLRARVTGDVRPGVVVAQSIWWRKLSPDGNNANALTSQALTDLGGGATFYDCLVEAEPVA